MKDADRYRLLRGPYRTPLTKVGDELFCEMRGMLRVCDFTRGPITWPKGKLPGAPPGIILCGDLVEAVRCESRQAVSHWWGVSDGTVLRWRKCLGVPPVTEGTRSLFRDGIKEKFTPEILEISMARRTSPEARSKGAHTLLLKMEAGEWGAKRNWTDEEDALLGKMSDKKAALKLDCAISTVVARRRELGIPPFSPRPAQRKSRGSRRFRPGVLRERREALGLTQKEVASRAGTYRGHYSRLEIGHHDALPAVALQLAAALGCGVEELLEPSESNVVVTPDVPLEFGPYRAPDVMPGDELYCELNGAVQVLDFSDAPIAWPRAQKRRGAPLILCGDLILAVNQESAASVAQWWGVSLVTVSSWRRQFNVKARHR